jgi:hypothetical protein
MRTVASVASMSIVGPSIAAAGGGEPPAGPDPIFAAMERCIRAEAAYLATDEDVSDELSDDTVAAREALARTRPTTFTGLAAYLRFLSHQSREVLGTFFFDNDRENTAFIENLDHAVAALLRGPGDPAAGGDAELLRLGASLDVAIAAAATTRRDLDAAEAEYEAHPVVRSDALRLREGDERFPIPINTIDGFYCLATDVDRLRLEQARGWQRFYAWPDAPNVFDEARFLSQRAGEIITAYDEWITACEAHDAEFDTERLDAEYDAKIEELDRLWKCIANIRATTVEGLAVKARLARYHRGRNCGDEPEMFASEDHEIGINICDDLAELTAAEKAPTRFATGIETVA